MARLIGPDEASRLAFTVRGDNALGTAAGLPAVFYADAGASSLADILALDGSPVPGSELAVEATSLLPLFQFPDGVDTVWVSVNGGPVSPVYARTDDRLDALRADVTALQGQPAGGGSGPGATATYTVTRSGSTYRATAVDGTVAAQATDTGTTSGLRAVLSAVVANDVHIHFAPGTYSFLDAPLGTESWCGVEDHMGFLRVKRLTLSGSGMGATVIRSRTNQFWVNQASSTASAAANDDTEPFSFTDSQLVTIRDMTIEAGGVYKSTTQAIDFDQGEFCRVERVQIWHSRAGGIIIDGGDTGKHAGASTFAGNLIMGRPRSPQLDLLTGGALTGSTAYRYAVSWRCQDLAFWAGSGVDGGGQLTSITASGTTATVATSVAHNLAVGDPVVFSNVPEAGYAGQWTVVSVPTTTTFTVTLASAPASGTATVTTAAVIGPGDTKPSDQAFVTTTSTSKSVKVYVPAGPSSCLHRKVYRWDATNGWRLVQTVAGNAETTWTDSSTASLSAAVFGAYATVRDDGVQLLSAKGCLVVDNTIDGTGDSVLGQTLFGVNVQRKGTGTVDASQNVISRNRIRECGGAGVRILGGHDNVIANNVIANPGTPAVKTHGVRIDAASTLTADRNQIVHNRIYDDRDANSPAGGVGIGKGVALALSGSNRPTDTLIVGNLISNTTQSPAVDVASGTSPVMRLNPAVPDSRRVVTLTDQATVTANTDTFDVGRLTMGGNRTINTSGTPVDGQQMTLELTQDATGSRTVTWGTSFAFSTDVPAPTLSTAAGKTDVLTFTYNAAAAKWRLLSVTRGF